MRKYVVRRLLLLIPTVFFVCVIVFCLLRYIPGSAIEALTYRMQSSGIYEVSEDYVRERLGMDKPAYIQFFIWLGNALRLDLGDSFFRSQSVSEIIGEHVFASLELGILSMILTNLIAIPLGVFCAKHQDSVADYAIRVISLILMSLPVFWIATIVLIYPSLWFHWAPTTEYVPFFRDPIGNLKMFFLPAILSAITTSGMQLRYVRTVMLDTMRTDYVRTARAKGVTERRIMYVHSFRNAMIPVITMIGGSIGGLIGGNIIMENLFSIPGLGQETVLALAERDYPIVQGCVLIMAIFTMVVNVIVDISYKWIDPRIKFD